jgi:hypothetical protein
MKHAQLADVIVHSAEQTTRAAADLAASTLADLPGCVLVAVRVRHGVLLAGRSSQWVLTPTDDILEAAIAAYDSLLRGNGIRPSRSASSVCLGSPLAE